MKILVVSSLYPPIYHGGYELECRDITEGLKARGHEVSVVTSMHGIGYPKVDEDVHRVMRLISDEVEANDYANKVGHLGTYLRAQKKVASICRWNARSVKAVLDKVRPDVAYVWNLDRLSMSPLAAISERHIPRLHRLGSRWMADGLAYHLSHRYAERVSVRILTGVKNPGFHFLQGHFITCSDSLGREIIRSGVPKDKVSTVYTYVPIPQGIPPLYDGPVFKMLWAGRVYEEKGTHIAVRAISELVKDPAIGPFELNIAGSGPEEYVSRVMREVAELGLSDKIHFCGAISREQLGLMYADHHAFVFTSVWDEPFGQVLTESMGYGLPIIASPAGGSAEFLVDEENALIFPIGDSLALAAAMKRLMKDRDLRMRLREGGRRTVTERFGLERTLDMHEYYLLTAAGLEAKEPAAMGSGIGHC